MDARVCELCGYYRYICIRIECREEIPDLDNPNEGEHIDRYYYVCVKCGHNKFIDGVSDKPTKEHTDSIHIYVYSNSSFIWRSRHKNYTKMLDKAHKSGNLIEYKDSLDIFDGLNNKRLCIASQSDDNGD